MRNLFVCHTQAQLILACGLSQGRFKYDENHLILYVDFNLNDGLKSKLDSVFSKSLYLQHIYPKEYDSYKAKLKFYPKNWKRIKDFLKEPYDEVFVVCDSIITTQKLIALAHQLNNNTTFNWLEDGILAYYQNVESHTGLGRNSFTLALREFIYKYVFKVGSFAEYDFPAMGGLRCLKKAYVLFPDLVREPYFSEKELIQITSEEYRQGLESMYEASPISIDSNSVIIVVDRIDTYLYPEKVKESLEKFIKQSKTAGKTIYSKFHPREDKKWDIFSETTILEKTVGIESFYLSLLANNVKPEIVGIKSTGLMSAKKMGFDVTTLFNECGETNSDLVKFFTNMGCKFEY